MEERFLPKEGEGKRGGKGAYCQHLFPYSRLKESYFHYVKVNRVGYTKYRAKNPSCLISLFFSCPPTPATPATPTTTTT